MTNTIPERTPLDREQILAMLGHLGAQLDDQGLTANIQVVGGAAMALTLANERMTTDVDAVVLNHNDEFHAAEIVTAKNFNASPDWVSDDVSDFVSRSPEGEMTLIALPGVNVYVASPEHLLAMKVRSSTVRGHPRDQADMVRLAAHLGLDTPQEIADLTAAQFRGVYRDRVGYDEYVDAAEAAFLVDDLANGRDPMIRWAASQQAVRPAELPAEAISSPEYDYGY